MKKRRWICLALTAALTIGMLAGCGQKKDLSDGGEKKKLQKVTLNEVAHSIFYAPMYVAIEEGYFREEGIDLTLSLSLIHIWMFETELLSTLEGTISLGDARICPFIPLTVKPAFVVASMVVYFRFSLMPKFT